MKRVLAYTTIITLMTAVFYLTKPTPVMFVVSALLNLALVALVSKAKNGTELGKWQKWTVRYKPDADSDLSVHFNQISREIIVDDEWEGLLLDERHAVLAHEAGHGADKAVGVMTISTAMLLAVGRAAMFAFVLRDGVMNAVVMLGASLAVCVAMVFITAIFTKKPKALGLKAVVVPVAAVLCGWQLAAASALMAAVKLVSLVISRESEHVADSYAKAGGHGVSLAKVLSRLPDASSIPAVLRTHPTNAQRVANLVR
jgi:hypothetical protein